MQSQDQETQNKVVVVSRTVCLFHGNTYSVSPSHHSTKVGNKQFMIFASVGEAQTAFNELKQTETRLAYLTYSLFVKSQTELTEELLRDTVLQFASQANITYLRVDDNHFTGKVVVDLLSDYTAIKTSNHADVRFFHFNPSFLKTRSYNTRRPGTQNRSGAGVQRPRQEAPQDYVDTRPRQDAVQQRAPQYRNQRYDNRPRQDTNRYFDNRPHQESNQYDNRSQQYFEQDYVPRNQLPRAPQAANPTYAQNVVQGGRGGRGGRGGGGRGGRETSATGRGRGRGRGGSRPPIVAETVFREATVLSNSSAI